jgi:hypothetical protein
MPNAAFGEPGQNVFDDATQGTRCAVYLVGHAGRAYAGGTKQIAQEFADPILGDQLLTIAVDRHRPKALTVLHVCIHATGKGGRRRGAAMATTINRCLMLCNLQARQLYVKNLTPLHPLDHPCHQAMLTDDRTPIAGTAHQDDGQCFCMCGCRVVPLTPDWTTQARHPAHISSEGRRPN